MQSTSEGNLLDIIDLAHSLRQEKLFISNEHSTFQKLHNTLNQNSSKILELSWIFAQQQQNLSNLVVANPDSGPAVCCNRANKLENVEFIDIYKFKPIKYQHVLSYIELFNYLHNSPCLVGQCLVIGDQIRPNKMIGIIQTIVNGLYGNGVHPKDVEMMLKLMRELIEIQVAVSEDPRRMLRAGSSSFARLYHFYHESSFSAKLFLTAALLEPLMAVLIEDDKLMEIDDKVRKKLNTTQLYDLVMKFIKSLIDNWMLFPSTLRWLVQTMCHFLKMTHVSEDNINAILTDMVFTHFICPAIVSPEIFGIIDAPISETARYNLMQIGQILQMLSLIKYQKPDGKFKDLCNRFQSIPGMISRDVIANLLEQLYPNDFEGLAINMSSIPQHQNNIVRNCILVTPNELNNFTTFLRSVLENDGLIISGEDRRKLSDILDQLPKNTAETTSNGDLNSSSTVNSSGTKSKQTLKNRLAKTMSLNAPHFDGDENQNGSLPLNHNNNNKSDEYNQVLVIPITIIDDNKFNLLSEEEVLSMNNISNEIQEPNLTEKNIEEMNQTNDKDNDIEVGALRNERQKNTRFSLTNDDVSDNLEAVSEAHSNHSVASSLDELDENDQNDNDNLSDMVSANVSGRGSPNISGRDTPSSQVTEGGGPQIPTPQMTKILNKARSDIEDKFCKFEIRKLIEGDETISIISDTWSTDVLASDSETIEANERNFSTPLIPSSVVLPGDHNYDPLAGAGSHLRANNLDISETQSESAWSTDVLASDSEKMTEIDTDCDNQSIAARSDITDSALRDREQEVPVGIINRAPDSPFYAARGAHINLRTGDISLYGPRTPESPFSTRSYDDSPGSIDFTARSSQDQDDLPRSSNSRFLVSNPMPSNELGAVGGLANNQFLNERNLNFVDDSRSYPSDNLLALRQNSTDSSNNSCNFENERMPKGNNMLENTVDDFIDFNNGFDEELAQITSKCENSEKNGKSSFKGIIKTSSNITNPFLDGQNEEPIFNNSNSTMPNVNNVDLLLSAEIDDIGNEFSVDRRQSSTSDRRIVQEQRNAIFDSRRNGMIDLQGNATTSINFSGILNNNSDHLININESDDFKKERNALAEYEAVRQTGEKLRQSVEKLGQSNEIGGNVSANLSINSTLKSPNLIKSATKSSTYSKTEKIQRNENGESILIQKTETLSILESQSSTSSKGAKLNTPKSSSKSTGAIPKSISFDSSADKVNKNDHLVVGNIGFLNKIKRGLKIRNNANMSSNGRSRHSNHNKEQNADYFNEAAQLGNRQAGFNGNCDALNQNESFLILDKYRRKASSSSDSTGSNNSSSLKTKSTQSDEIRLQNGIGNGKHDCDETNSCSQRICVAIVKKKLRLVFSNTDLLLFDFRQNAIESPLLIYLQIQLAQALSNQNLQQVSYISELLRCLNRLDGHLHQQLLNELQQELVNRQSYIQYLIRYRQFLLSSNENITKFEKKLQNDRNMAKKHLIMICVKMFLEKRESVVLQFYDNFTLLTVVDEKMLLLEEFVSKLVEEISADVMQFGLVEDWQLEEARYCIERILFQRLYRFVMFPNDDGDISRDQVLHSHIQKLQRVVSPTHALLRIPAAFLNEAPWPVAQTQISYISAYKTPSEKVQCVVRCITCILNLLNMANEGTPAADDLIPVLIYVLIQANPPYLLSTIDYVNCFIGNKLTGESQYWWTQFCSAVAFIKTMDYSQ